MNLLPYHDLYVTVPLQPSPLWTRSKREEFIVRAASKCEYYGTGHGLAFQISAAYCAIVRSLENFPEPAMFRIPLRAHWSWSAWSSHNRRSASR